MTFYSEHAQHLASMLHLTLCLIFTEYAQKTNRERGVTAFKVNTLVMRAYPRR
jgi:hypothetical protein